MASEWRMKVSLRVKNYLNVMSFLSSAMTGLALCSHGRRMLTPKLFSGPAPSWPACMMPGPAPVITMKPAAEIFLPNSAACWYSALVGCVRAQKRRHRAERLNGADDAQELVFVLRPEAVAGFRFNGGRPGFKKPAYVFLSRAQQIVFVRGARLANRGANSSARRRDLRIRSSLGALLEFVGAIACE